MQFAAIFETLMTAANLSKHIVAHTLVLNVANDTTVASLTWRTAAMPMRWIILLVLFLVRTVMAFQFQSVAALSPFIMENLAITLTDIGVLIGLYLGPGIIVAGVGGAVATWFGDKRTVIASLVLMVLGGVMVAYASTLGWAVAGRVVSGVGGVVINVLMTKMVIDWFAGRNVSTALGIFISSWPLGIALALLVLPALAASADLALAWTVVVVTTLLALLLFAIVYRTPDGMAQNGKVTSMTALPWAPLICAGLLWGLYNAAFAMIMLMMIAPALAGELADRIGDVNVAFILGSVMTVLAILALLAFNRTASSLQASTA